MSKPKPSYYAIIPASVRYASITANAKLLYGEITSLCNQEGYCWASNSYFADLYQKDNKSVSRWIEELRQLGVIHIQNGKSRHRKIYLDKNDLVAATKTKMSKSPRQNCPSDMDKNVQRNNTNNNKKEYSSERQKIFSELEHAKGLKERLAKPIPKHLTIKAKEFGFKI